MKRLPAVNGIDKKLRNKNVNESIAFVSARAAALVPYSWVIFSKREAQWFTPDGMKLKLTC